MDVINTSSQFRATKRMLLSGTFSKSQFPMEYSTWMELDADYKAAALFVNFYRVIVLAWSKFNKPVITTDVAVSAILDKLQHIIPALMDTRVNSKQNQTYGFLAYTEPYIYTACYRAILDESKGVLVNLRYHLETSNEASDWTEDDVIDLFDLIGYYDEPIEDVRTREALWTIIENMGPKALKVVDHLINGSSLRKSHKGDGDLLADVSVSADEYPLIVKELKKKIAPLGSVWGY